jgi:CBS domain-containing protein
MKAIYVSARETGSQTRPARKHIINVMSKPPIVVSGRELLDDALVKMISAGVRHLVVVDEAGRCVGVLSDRAITAVWATDFNALAVRNVASALDGEPATISVLNEVIDAAILMRAQGVDALAVTDTEGRPLGIVTGSDLVALLAI